ncbi:GNAT family N-acetyltransferase [Paenibacillus sp. Marseille-Q4541]|uniref:GNAT family N-acetyltransferase n=1 Tax=Paenibacillus sp. Marseille-Q4541 TaxID=2831522 RepID=UPI001BA818D2|nr:GNAT family N-acetyltransferase [Paenibacillus sp. Marseille-Q4541]
MIEVTHDIPSAESYLNLRRAAGLSEMSREGAEKGLPATLFAVSLRDGDKLIGMGRVVGDGGLQFFVSDIAVHPDFQGKGYGKTIMKEIKAYIDEHVPGGGIVSLIADKPADRLYEQFGFADAAPNSLGMWFKQKRK